MSLKPSVIYTLILTLFVITLSSSAMTEFSDDASPVTDRSWPRGTAKVANHSGRFGFWEHGMIPITHFEFRCKDTADFNDALKIFAQIQPPMSRWRPNNSPEDGAFETDDAHRLTLVVQDGPEYLASFMQQKITDKEKRIIDWRFSVASPVNWNMQFNRSGQAPFFAGKNFHQAAPPPQIEVFIYAKGPIVWSDVKVPANIRVIDQRAESAPVKSTNGGLVRGTIYDMNTGQPIRDAEIVLKSIDQKEATRAKTDGHGFAELSALPPGQYSIVVRAAKFAARIEGEYTNKANTVHEFALELAGQSSIKGTVSDAANHPLAGVTVTASYVVGPDGGGYACPDGTAVKTNEQGQFEITALPWQGVTDLSANFPDLHQTADSRSLIKIPSTEVKIIMTGTGTVGGKVPLDTQFVHIQPPGKQRVGMWGGSMKPKDDGSFEFKGVPPGEYLVSADPNFPFEGRAADAKSVTVKAGETVEVEITKVGKK